MIFKHRYQKSLDSLIVPSDRTCELPWKFAFLGRLHFLLRKGILYKMWKYQGVHMASWMLHQRFSVQFRFVSLGVLVCKRGLPNTGSFNLWMDYLFFSWSNYREKKKLQNKTLILVVQSSNRDGIFKILKASTKNKNEILKYGQPRCTNSHQ